MYPITNQGFFKMIFGFYTNDFGFKNYCDCMSMGCTYKLWQYERDMNWISRL